ncbi:MAG: metal ABC transporter permease [Candidatus Sericytochromatia bacterium]|nr:metal ABC transporter permease [Candidatus Sericytochromatia bacterium]
MAVDAAPHLAQLLDGWELFRDPILVGATSGAVLGVLGVFVVLRRMVFAAAALTQAAGCGVALAFFLEIHAGLAAGLAAPRAWSLGLTLLATLALQWPGRRVVTRESLLALAYMLGGGGALLLGSRISQEAHDIQAILFGTGVVVDVADLTLVLGVGGLIAAWLAWWHRGFWFATLDPERARVRGLPVAWLDLALLLMLAVYVSVTTRALGALPVFAFSVLPAVGAIAVASRPTVALGLAAALGALAGGGGYVLAFLGGFPVGASQTVVAAGLVGVALAWRAAAASLGPRGPLAGARAQG